MASTEASRAPRFSAARRSSTTLASSSVLLEQTGPGSAGVNIAEQIETLEPGDLLAYNALVLLLISVHTVEKGGLFSRRTQCKSEFAAFALHLLTPLCNGVVAGLWRRTVSVERSAASIVRATVARSGIDRPATTAS